MEKLELSEETIKHLEAHRPICVGNWTASCCCGKRFKVNNNGIKLIAKEDEGLEKIVFDVDKKTVSVVIKQSTMSDKAPRTLDLSNDIEFFEALREDIESLLTERGEYESVTPNADRTVFDVF